MGRLMKQLYPVLQISPIRTSAYYSQTDGLLERWHADLLSKATFHKKDRKLYLHNVLFAYRAMPHTVTEFSPFQHIYGHDVRGPLEVLCGNWMDGNNND